MSEIDMGADNQNLASEAAHALDWEHSPEYIAESISDAAIHNSASGYIRGSQDGEVSRQARVSRSWEDAHRQAWPVSSESVEYENKNWYKTERCPHCGEEMEISWCGDMFWIDIYDDPLTAESVGIEVDISDLTTGESDSLWDETHKCTSCGWEGHIAWHETKYWQSEKGRELRSKLLHLLEREDRGRKLGCVTRRAPNNEDKS